MKALVEFANARYRQLKTYNETALENVVLRVLLELVQDEDSILLNIFTTA